MIRTEPGAGKGCIQGMTLPRMKSKKVSPLVVPEIISKVYSKPSLPMATMVDIRVPLTSKR